MRSRQGHACRSNRRSHGPSDGGRDLTAGDGRDLTAFGGRTPTLHAKIDSAAAADRTVARGAGAGRIP
ncbi:hypothetical protein QA802_10875 [Streptomyces sp. B21-105]|uniref:hypothetical protein n=1 Tax=Streptomyces sp. B21-105 TaxID=3039417 RepID=UPI002FF37248